MDQVSDDENVHEDFYEDDDNVDDLVEEKFSCDNTDIITVYVSYEFSYNT